MPVPDDNASFTPRAAVHIPILTFHHIRVYHARKNTNAWWTSVSPEHFRADLQWLHDHDYTSIDLDEFLNIVRHEIPGPLRPVVLTFDDGYRDHYENAFPILQEFHMVGVFYVNPDMLGHRAYMTKEQVQELDAKGMQIASHTSTHSNLRQITYAQQKDEIGRSKADLEAWLHHPVIHFAYPYGNYNKDSIRLLRNFGYVTATTVKRRAATDESPLLELPRISLADWMTPEEIFMTTSSAPPGSLPASPYPTSSPPRSSRTSASKRVAASVLQ